MTYFGIRYVFLFLPIVVLLYNFVPKKIKPLLLLIASYVFFYIKSKKLIVFLILSSLSIYLAGLMIKKIIHKRDEIIREVTKEEKKSIKEKFKNKKKLVLVLTIVFNVAFLFYFKYLNFFFKVLNGIFSVSGLDMTLKLFKHLAPIGISFYTLQAISYLVDVYNEKIEADENPLKVMLYLAFFPTVMEGPITRFNDVKDKIWAGCKVKYQNLCFGYQRIMFGLFKKYVIADRLNIFVKLTFKHYMDYSGITLALGAIFYTILLYMEFSGTMDIVIGTAEIFDIKIKENFKQPFLSKNISEFWSRWHISLGLWFKDYIFYPVSLSKGVKNLTSNIRKKWGNKVSSLIMGAIALFAVWSLNGLWHGAGYTFIVFGYYHFILILLGNIFEPTIVKVCEKNNIDRKSGFYKTIQIIKTTILVFIGELIFRAPNLTVAFGMLKRIFTKFSLNGFKTEVLTLGLDISDFIIVLLALVVIIIISLLREKDINIREKISTKPIVFRWALFYALIIAIILFGAFGPGYAPVDPIYADF